MLWDGTTTWGRCSRGIRADVDAEHDISAITASTAALIATVPPPMPPVRSEFSPAAALRALPAVQTVPEGIVAEIGVGVVHGDHTLPATGAPTSRSARAAPAGQARVRPKRSMQPRARSAPSCW